jgi:uncharacterized membrane protein
LPGGNKHPREQTVPNPLANRVRTCALTSVALGTRWESLRSSLWFLPSLLVVSAVILANALVALDPLIDPERLSDGLPYYFGAGAEGSRGMLSAIATSTITLAGVAFSITIVALSLASSQYSSRILRSFMRDRANQTVLGTLVGIYVYCLIVLRTVRGGDDAPFIPSIAVFFAILLAFVGIGSFIFFIHHIANSIQAESIIKSASDETVRTIDRLFPADLACVKSEGNDRELASDFNKELDPDDALSADLQSQLDDLKDIRWETLSATQSGFLRVVDYDGLLTVAREQDVIIRLEQNIGDFIVEDSPIVSLAAPGEVSDRKCDYQTLTPRVNELFSVGHQRTKVQDVGFGIRQIVDIALRALSSGVNDTTTAVTCVHYLCVLLSRIADRPFPSPYLLDGGQLRVITQVPTFAKMLSDSFDQIRQNARGNVAVLVILLQTIDVIQSRVTHPARRQELLRHVEAIAAVIHASGLMPADREQIDHLLQRLAKIF